MAVLGVPCGLSRGAIDFNPYDTQPAQTGRLSKIVAWDRPIVVALASWLEFVRSRGRRRSFCSLSPLSPAGFFFGELPEVKFSPALLFLTIPLLSFVVPRSLCSQCPLRAPVLSVFVFLWAVGPYFVLFLHI